MPAKNKSRPNQSLNHSRPLRQKNCDDEVFGRAGKALGSSRFQVQCEDGQTRLGIVRGKLTKGAINHINEGDLVLVSLRSFQDNKADIVWRYTADEIRQLKKIGYLEHENGTEVNHMRLQAESDKCVFDFETI